VVDGLAALVHLAAHPPDLIVLDLSLPKLDGVEVLAQLRARHYDSSVLVLTGRSDLDARVQCLNIGADDCLLKPFNYSELIARCRALLRRREQFADPMLRHGELQMNRRDRKVMRGDRTIELTAKEFALLEFLLLHRGECVPRSVLLAEIWQMSSNPGTNVVDVYINYLRRKLATGEAEDSAQPLIETVRGEGYRLGGPGGKKKAMSVGKHEPASLCA